MEFGSPSDPKRYLLILYLSLPFNACCLCLLYHLSITSSPTDGAIQYDWCHSGFLPFITSFKSPIHDSDCATSLYNTHTGYEQKTYDDEMIINHLYVYFVSFDGEISKKKNTQEELKSVAVWVRVLGHTHTHTHRKQRSTTSQPPHLVIILSAGFSIITWLIILHYKQS